jgi:hypothetical protein
MEEAGSGQNHIIIIIIIIMVGMEICMYKYASAGSMMICWDLQQQ